MDKTLSCGLKDPGSIPGRGSLFYTTHAHSVGHRVIGPTNVREHFMTHI